MKTDLAELAFDFLRIHVVICNVTRHRRRFWYVGLVLWPGLDPIGWDYVENVIEDLDPHESNGKAKTEKLRVPPCFDVQSLSITSRTLPTEGPAQSLALLK